MITGKELVEKLYSEAEENNNLLQEIYEKAFSEGYEYAQKEFARRDYEGLTPDQIDELKSERKIISRYLKNVRDLANDTFNKQSISHPEKLKEVLKNRNDLYTKSIKEFKNIADNEARRIKGIKDKTVLNKISNLVKNNPKMAIGGTLLATAGTIGTGIAMSGNKKEDKK